MNRLLPSSPAKFVLRRPESQLTVSCYFSPDTDPMEAFQRACETHEVPPDEPGVSFFRVGRLRSTTTPGGLHGHVFTDYWREPGEWIVSP